MTTFCRSTMDPMQAAAFAALQQATQVAPDGTTTAQLTGCSPSTQPPLQQPTLQAREASGGSSQNGTYPTHSASLPPVYDGSVPAGGASQERDALFTANTVCSHLPDAGFVHASSSSSTSSSPSPFSPAADASQHSDDRVPDPQADMMAAFLCSQTHLQSWVQSSMFSLSVKYVSVQGHVLRLRVGRRFLSIAGGVSCSLFCSCSYSFCSFILMWWRRSACFRNPKGTPLGWLQMTDKVCTCFSLVIVDTVAAKEADH